MPQRVLIIDDSRAVRTLAEVRLKDEPIELLSADSGDAGLELARTAQPDLILLDVEMPEVNGFEVCRQLKADARTAAIPVLFLTGAATSEERVRGLELGAVDYVTKPFDPAELRARVRVALRVKYMVDLLAQKAQVDALTGLWNRRYFDERLYAERSIARRNNKPLAILMLDVDHFKDNNDKYGHPAGDELLRRVALTITETVRTEDVVCRYGGEEFAIIAPGISTGVEPMAERIRSAVEAMVVTLGPATIKATASIGVAWCAQGDDDTLVPRADEALYRAKQNGRNRVELGAARAAA